MGESEAGKTRMEKARLAIAGVCLSLVLLVASGCASSDADVVARVNGQDLPVSVLTTYIDSVRSGVGSSTDAAWEAYLADAGYTVDEYWNYLIEHYAREMVLEQKCNELNITVSESEIDTRIETMKSLVGAVDDDTEFLWELYLQGVGMDEQGIRDEVEYNLRVSKLYEQEIEREEPSDEVIQAYADTYHDSYSGVRSSTICFGLYDGTLPQQVLDELLANPDADFAAYADEYNEDDTFAAAGGDAGWSSCVSLPSAYAEALSELEVGHIYPELVYSGDYCFIIKATDVYECVLGDDGSVDLDAMPDDVYSTLYSDVSSYHWSYQCQVYAEELYQQADVEILIEHQYDVAGQSHGNVSSSSDDDEDGEGDDAADEAADEADASDGADADGAGADAGDAGTDASGAGLMSSAAEAGAASATGGDSASAGGVSGAAGVSG